MKSEFMIAITQLAAEKNLPKEVVLQAMEAALVSAYKKDVDSLPNVLYPGVRGSPVLGSPVLGSPVLGSL